MKLDTVRAVQYGKARRISCVFLCQHGDMGEKLFARYPSLPDLCVSGRQKFMQYIAVEQDAGTPELAHILAKMASDADHASLVVHAELPRGVVDPNRITERSLQEIIDWRQHPDLASELKGLHADTLAHVAALLAETKPRLVIDVHSMGQYTPRAKAESDVRAVTLAFDRLEEYLEAWLDPARRGERRVLDIVTALADGTVVADMQFARMMAGELDMVGIDYRFNHPYPTAPHVMTTAYLRQYPGGCIDVPKDMLADGALDAMRVNLRKVERVARPIANAAIAYLGQQVETMHEAVAK